jgi:putative flippase GtrA
MRFDRKLLKLFLKFGLVGLSNTVIGYLIYAVSLKLMRSLAILPRYDYYVAQFFMFVLSVAWSFYWNNKYVFKQQENTSRHILGALLKTYASYAFTSLFLSEVLLSIWVEHLGINEYLAPILSLVITVPLNFVIQKYWAFRDTGKEENAGKTADSQ